jgi:Ras-related protein Rab-1A
MRFACDEFSERFITTIGIDFKFRDVEIDGENVKVQVQNIFLVSCLSSVNKMCFSHQIWDTAGQERYRSVAASYYRGSHAIFLIYDITDMVSFEAVVQWMDEIQLVRKV